jgi:DNA-binding MarR family transcriptional regulator
LRHFSLAANRLRTTVAAQLPINVTELIALGQLAESAERTPTQLAQDLSITTASVTVLVDHLESAGFVYRTRSTVDRRSLMLSLTPAGTHIMRRLQEQYRAAIVEAFEQSGATLAPEITAFLEQVSRTLAEFIVGEPGPDPIAKNQ